MSTFLQPYESTTIHFAEGDVTVTLFPTGEYAATGENDEGVYKGFGDTLLAAIADYRDVVTAEAEPTEPGDLPLQTIESRRCVTLSAKAAHAALSKGEA